LKSNAITVEQYLKDLPEVRRKSMEIVREGILANLPDCYEVAIFTQAFLK